MAKHRSPSKIKYDKENPPVTVRFTKDLRDVLSVVQGSRKPGPVIKEIVKGRLEPALELKHQMDRMQAEKCPEGYITMQVRKTTLFLFNQTLSEEAGKRGESYIEQDKFIRFLLNLYQAVKGDFLVLPEVRRKTGK